MSRIWRLFEKIVDNILKFILQKKYTKELSESLLQFVKFGFVGLSNTVISYVVYILLIFFNVHYLIASMLGFVISVINSFYWNNKYVFKDKNHNRSLVTAFIKTFISYAGTGLLLANILLFIWIDLVHASEVIAPIINLFITIPLNFLLNKLWAFRNKK